LIIYCNYRSQAKACLWLEIHIFMMDIYTNNVIVFYTVFTHMYSRYILQLYKIYLWCYKIWTTHCSKWLGEFFWNKRHK